MFTAILVASLASVVSAKEWKIMDGTAATTLVGCGADSDVNGVCGACSNGIGAFMERYDGTEIGKEKFSGAGLIMDAATDSTYTVAVSMLPIIISKDGGKTYTTSETLGGLSQSNDVTNGVISMVGTFTEPKSEGNVPAGKQGVARSVDGGETWSVSEIADGYVRYGAYPSADTWYVSSGMWPADEVESLQFAMEDKLQHKKTHQFSARAAVSDRGVKFKQHKRVGANETDSGYTAFISKTTDGGKTWSNVFPNDPKNNYFYFNAIDCSSDLHCVAVAEGEDAETGDYDIKAFVTFDGGESWTNAIPKETWPADTMMVSIAGAAWVDENEGWLGATSKSRSMLQAQFFHTTDGGKTFSVAQQLNDCFVMDLDFAANTGSSVGYASCIGSSGASASMALYA
jgi:hypothetical protein